MAADAPQTDTAPTDAALSESATADDLAQRLLESCTGAMELLAIHLGLEVGAYEPLRDGATEAQVASAAGITPRYAREWLEQQVAARIIRCDDPAAPSDARIYRLPPGHAEALLDSESPAYTGPLSTILAGVARAVPLLPDAMRTGGGVPYRAYGPELRTGISALNAPDFHNNLAATWLASMPDIIERLLAEPPARVVDLGCGEGASTIALALGFPAVHVLGVDLDEPSIYAATDAAVATGLANRVAFETIDARDLADHGPFVLATIFEALHDMGDPVGVLRGVRAALAPGGAVLVADERTADTFTDRPDFRERLNYGFSVLHCLPATMAEEWVEANGTVLRAPTVARWAAEAGFGSCTRLPVEHDFWQFYRLDG